MLDGWAPRTFHEYDGEGRLVSTRTEPEFDDVETGWLLALGEYRESLCPLCGMPRDVCQAPYGKYVYGTHPPTRCHITDAIETAQAAHKRTSNPRALLYQPIVAPWGTSLDGG